MAQHKPPESELLRLRMQLALNIAEHLQIAFRLGTRQARWDTDQAAHHIDAMIPLTAAEAAAAYEEATRESERAKDKKDQPSGPLVRLREALGLGAEISMRQILEAAIERVQELAAVKRKPTQPSGVLRDAGRVPYGP